MNRTHAPRPAPAWPRDWGRVTRLTVAAVALGLLCIVIAWSVLGPRDQHADSRLGAPLSTAGPAGAIPDAPVGPSAPPPPPAPAPVTAPPTERPGTAPVTTPLAPAPTAFEAQRLLQDFLDAAQLADLDGDPLPVAELVTADCETCWGAAHAGSPAARAAGASTPTHAALVTVHTLDLVAPDSAAVSGNVAGGEHTGYFEATLHREGALWLVSSWSEPLQPH
ncbi:hypothetical protein JT358_11075 [Micrococcales bacterium 31B]|nr:hypothetical protein [Micrococcales bacterium 31B]